MENPVVFTALMPFLLSAVSWLLARFALRGAASCAMAGIAPGISFVIAALLILGVPMLPPVAATHKIMVLAAFAVLMGFVLTLSGTQRRTVRWLFLLLWAVGLAWLGQRVLLSEHWWQVALVFGAGVAALIRLQRIAADGIAGMAHVMLCAAGLSIVALLSSSASVAQAAGALAAACGALMLINWPRMRLPVLPAALLAVAIVLAFLAAQVVFFTQANIWAVAAAFLVFGAGLAASQLVSRHGLQREVWLPVLLVAIGSLPVGVAVLLLRAAGE